MEIAWCGLILSPQIKFKFKNNSLHVNILFSSWKCYLKVYFLSSICFWLFFLSEISLLCAYRISSGFSIMLCCSLCWSLCPVYVVLSSKVLHHIETRYCDVIRFVPLLKNALAIWSILWFHMNFLGCFNDASRDWYFDVDFGEFANCLDSMNMWQYCSLQQRSMVAFLSLCVCVLFLIIVL